MPFTTRSTVAMSSTTTRVTPTDELEQSSFDSGACDDISPQATFQQQQHCHDAPEKQWQCSMSALESIIDATLLPYNSFYSPAADATSFAEPPPRPVVVSEYHDHLHREHDRDEYSSSNSSRNAAHDVLQAAGILCHFKKEVIRDCSVHGTDDIVEVAVKMLTDENEEEIFNDAMDVQHFLPIDEDHEEARVGTTNSATIASSLQHPDRLAIVQDAEEVNKLHQYVRKELLEVFVVPRDSVSSSDTSDDEDDDNASEDDDKEDNEHKSYAKDVKDIKRALNGMSRSANISSSSSNTSSTRHLVTRRRSITVSTVPTSTTTAQRYYPGRVGLRCAHCAHVRRKSTSKAAFYPLRIKNMYREVCAWQRIHFKNCKHVPHTVRQRYDHYKRIDPSRGKVKYWESSARTIGLENNPSR